VLILDDIEIIPITSLGLSNATGTYNYRDDELRDELYVKLIFHMAPRNKITQE
jgi:hypothetical protein